MKIAMPVVDGKVNPHFGTSRDFAVVEVVDGKVANKKIVTAEGMAHNHGGLAGLIQEEKVDVVIVGGIGGSMIQALEGIGLKVVSGASGEIDTVAEAYVAGTLETTSSVCSCGGHSN